jgi:hypothetical protein
MPATIISLIIQIIAGIAAGNVVGAAFEKVNLGPVVTSLAGAFGGFVVGQIFSLLMPDTAGITGGLSAVAIIGHLVAGGIGGAIATVIAGLTMKPVQE